MRFAFLLIFLAVQDPKKPPQDDVVQMREEAGGGFRVGKLVKVDENGIEMQLKDQTKTIRIEFKEMQPGSAYRIKSARIEAGNAQAHFDLGEFCRTAGLFSLAVREFEEAVALDKGFEEKAKKKIEETRNEEARTKFEDAKRLSLLKKWRDASALLRVITDKFSDTPYFEDAKKEIEKIAEAVKKENEEKEKMLEEKKKAEEAKGGKSKEEAEKALLGQCLDALKDAEAGWSEGLDWEGKDNVTKADRAWKAAEARLSLAQKNLEILLKSNDVETLKKAKDAEILTNEWMVKICYRLGALWAVQLNFQVAREYLNKAIKLPHDAQMDHLINETLLTLNQIQMRQRAAGKGY